MTFVEVLVAIVLLGTVVIATLVGLQAATTASTVDANHARALAWLHTASDAVYKAPRVACAIYDGSGDQSMASNWVSNKPALITQYTNAINNAVRPQGWGSATIQLIGVEYLGRPSPTATFFEWNSSYCFEGVQNINSVAVDFRDSPLYSQKLTIRVTDPTGKFSKTLETVKNER